MWFQLFRLSSFGQITYDKHPETQAQVDMFAASFVLQIFEGKQAKTPIIPTP